MNLFVVTCVQYYTPSENKTNSCALYIFFTRKNILNNASVQILQVVENVNNNIVTIYRGSVYRTVSDTHADDNNR